MCYPDKKRIDVLNDYQTMRNVSALCQKHGISRGTFYKWLQGSQADQPLPPRKQARPEHLVAIDSLLRQRWCCG